MKLTELNLMTEAEFVHRLGGIFEHSPWVAQGAVNLRPFSDRAALHSAMANVVRTAEPSLQLALIRAHPELAGKAAVRGELTAESTREQSGAGLNLCSAAEFEQLQTLNSDYNKKFGFPFIIAVRGHHRASIIENFARRLQAEPAVEMRECLEQIIKIAEFRLADVVEVE